MRNKILTIAALSTLAAAPAFAQSTAPSPSTDMTPPAASSPSSDTKPAGAMGSSSAAATGAFIDAQQREQWLATDLIGAKVRGAADENLGAVNDVLLDRNGNIIGAVIGVGGFLGIGEKDVAVPFDNLELVRSSDGDKLILRKSKDELKNAPEFKEYTPPAPTAAPAPGGSATSPMTSPPAAR
ncbi:PRC-barrel domain-containing protein [Aquabacter sp. CN5-332]|uniref:PRC-barrel domain-containing protein n=1 Tax=Aquabacter sp. CN5-332 TaxID=3156608 RepID=UPI0032B58022